MGRPPKTDRNNEIAYDVTVSQMTIREVAEKHGISESRVYQIIRDQSQHDLSEDIHIAMHALGLQRVQRSAMEIMDEPPKPMFDVKGNPLIHPVTGEPVLDKTEQIKSQDMFMRASEQLRKLYGRDKPRKQEIILSEQRDESQRALEALRNLVLNQPDLVKDIAASIDMKAIPGEIEFGQAAGLAG